MWKIHSLSKWVSGAHRPSDWLPRGTLQKKSKSNLQYWLTINKTPPPHLIRDTSTSIPQTLCIKNIGAGAVVQVVVWLDHSPSEGLTGWNPEIWKCGFSKCKHFATPFTSTSSSNRISDWLERDMVSLGIPRQHRNYEGKQGQETNEAWVTGESSLGPKRPQKLLLSAWVREHGIM